jgi:hypothetical protein
MKGMEKDIALQKAKLDYLKSNVGKQNDLPFYWSHLQVIGNSQAIVFRLNPYMVFIFSLIAIFALLIIYQFYIKNVFSKKSEF